MITFDEEAPDTVIQDGIELFKAHYEELDKAKDYPFDPDFQQYEDLFTRGFLRVYTARSDGELIGYAVFVLVTPLHSRTIRQAVQDLVYLHPDYRKGRTGLDLIAYAEDELARDGVDSVLQYAYRGSALSRILALRGYKEYPQGWFKRLAGS